MSLNIIDNFMRFHALLENNSLCFRKENFKEVLLGFFFRYISETYSCNEAEKQKIIESAKNSNVIIIDQNKCFNEKMNKKNLILCFEKSLIVLDGSSILYLNDILSANARMSICYLSNSKEIIQEKFNVKNSEIKNDSNFIEEIQNLSLGLTLITQIRIMKQIWSFISPCILNYLLIKSYIGCKKYRIQNFIYDLENDSKLETINQNEYIELRIIGKGSISQSVLIYHIKRGELYALKKAYSKDFEIPKLVQREVSNYKKIKHPFLPKFYGTVQDKGYIITEYIKGETLLKVKNIKLSYDEKATILFELMMIIKYFHDNKLIYRDLKPDNVIIDENKTAVLIDFDRLIENDTNQEHTLNFFSDFCDPEINITKKFTFGSDIYSLGKMIGYLLKQKEADINSKKSFVDYIYTICTNESSTKRPSILDLIKLYILNFHDKIKIEQLFCTYKEHFMHFEEINKILKKYDEYKNGPILNFFLGNIYNEGIYIPRNIQKTIHYFTLASNQNHREAQYALAFIYHEGTDIPRDIKKVIYYLSLAADQNHPEAQYYLGILYVEGKEVQADYKKGIHYFTLASHQNHSEAQLVLGFIYHDGIYIQQDINKSIHFLTLASRQNHPEAQFSLGLLFYENKCVQRDINKSIYYFTLASNNNHPQAQYLLGCIFYENKYIREDMNKSIHYFTLASINNHPKAQYCLGVFYYNGNYVPRDINKSIHYFSLASNKNHLESQFFLGLIYFSGTYLPKDINKAIYYLSLASSYNHQDAQFLLGIIYYDEDYSQRDINKSIYYFTLASNQNHPEAHDFLGRIYYEGKYVKQNISKAIHYFLLASSQCISNSQFTLGQIYFLGQYVPQDIMKSIHFLTLASNQNHFDAQFQLGLIYYLGLFIEQNIKKGIYYIILASKNGSWDAHFCYGFLLHEGKSLKRDIDGAIHYYKEASTFNIQFAKNNLGVIYLKGFGNQIKKSVGTAVEYFDEAIRRKKDYLSMYNLAHTYIYEETIKQDIDKLVELLIESSSHFLNSVILLSIFLIKNFGFDIERIKSEITKRAGNNSKLVLKVSNIVKFINILGKSTFESLFDIYRTKIFLYNIEAKPILITKITEIKIKEVSPNYPKAKNISHLFYEGFGIDL
ncbi:hypothetical protein M9Y10_029626 [Tritrichomonas musculus]|uniref:Protein kinase domain-containing protein n=1 Tax=Tritrichomonas musculus TaxID=1915356 RepID=A0ABR2KQZ2_9EUKA